MKLEEMRENALETANGLDEVADLLQAEGGLDHIVEKLHERSKALRDHRFQIVVVGEFKRGKSTFLNAMLGKRVLPQKASPCTAVVTEIRYGDEPSIRVVFNDGGDERLSPEQFLERYELKIEDVAYSAADEESLERYERDLDQALRDRFGHISHAELSYPITLCRHGVELVDSPGLEEHSARDARVLKYLDGKTVAAVIMVLDAVHLLNQREIRFIEQKLSPLGLRRNTFFVINRWNQLLESVVDPDDPEELARAVSEQQKLIDARLKPFCRIDGEDHSEVRIFRINALGALQQRIAKAPSAEKLEASGVPAFESGLERFLREGRHRARQDRDRVVLDETRVALRRHVRIQMANAEAPLEKLRKRHAELQPKLEQLREVGRHINNYLSSKASLVSDDLCRLFDAYCEEHIVRPLPEMVQALDLGRADGLFMSFDAVLDIFRPEGKKFKDMIAAHLSPQIADYLVPRVVTWSDSLKTSYIKQVASEIQTELHVEAGNYVSIIEQIDQQVEGQAEGLSIQDQLQKWLSDFRGSGKIGGTMNELGFDMAPLIGGIVMEIAMEVTSHMTLHILPGIGFIISGILLVTRRNRRRETLRNQILQGITEKMPEFRLSQHEAIRTALTEGFGKLHRAIGGKIQDDIATNDSSIRSLIREREEHADSVRDRRQALDELVRSFESKVKTIQLLLRNHLGT